MPRVSSLLATATAVGAAFGCTEALVRVLDAGTPSILRRAAGLALTGTLLYAALGLVAGLLVAAGWRLIRRHPILEARIALDAITFAALCGALFALGSGAVLRKVLPARFSWIPPAGMVVCAILILWALRSLYVLACRQAERSRGFASFASTLRYVLIAIGVASPAAALTASLFAGGPFGLSLSTPGPPDGSGAIRATLFRPNIVLILVDTLRADHLSCYGSQMEPTPRTDELARRGVLFENAYAPSSWTTPSVVSLLTSRYPSEHGATRFDSVAPGELPTLPGLLALHGYATAAVVGNPLLHHEGGFDRGYGLYDTYAGQIERSLFTVSLANSMLKRAIRLPLHDRITLYPRLGLTWPPRVRIDLSDYVRSDEVTDLALDVLDGLAAGPFFLYLHYGDPHTPYLHHPFGFFPQATRLAPDGVAHVIDRYHGEVVYGDQQVGRFMDGLESRGLVDNTIIVFLADRGEEFREHGVWEHGHNLHEQVLRIPFLMAGPGIPEGVRVPAPVDLMDVAPTLLRLAGAPMGPGFRGRVLLPRENVAFYDGIGPAPMEAASWAWASDIPSGADDGSGGERETLAGGHPIFSQLDVPTMSHTRQASILLDGWRYIRHHDGEGALVDEELYSRLDDPEELHDLSEAMPERLAALRGRLGELEASLEERTSERILTEELMERLRSLGYLD